MADEWRIGPIESAIKALAVFLVTRSLVSQLLAARPFNLEVT
jgi:hypothetical protein